MTLLRCLIANGTLYVIVDDGSGLVHLLTITPAELDRAVEEAS